MITFIDGRICALFRSHYLSMRFRSTEFNIHWFSFPLLLQHVMSQRAFGSSFAGEMEDITPKDSVSRASVLNQVNDSQQSEISSMAASTVKLAMAKKSDEPPERSVLIFMKDDKYESNVDYLKELMEVF